jgi:hypothetical protein
LVKFNIVLSIVGHELGNHVVVLPWLHDLILLSCTKVGGRSTACLFNIEWRGHGSALYKSLI